MIEKIAVHKLSVFLFLRFSFLTHSHGSVPGVSFISACVFTFWQFFIKEDYLFKGLFFRKSTIKLVFLFFWSRLYFLLFVKGRLDDVNVGINVVVDGELVYFFVLFLLFHLHFLLRLFFSL